MKHLGLALMTLGTMVVLAANEARADTIYEVEHARGNARAGGPTNAHDAELLNRWGATTGTPGWRHHYPEIDSDGYDSGPRVRYREHRRRDRE